MMVKHVIVIISRSKQHKYCPAISNPKDQKKHFRNLVLQTEKEWGSLPIMGLL